MKSTEPTTCYFTRDELRVLDAIAERTERPRSKVVQFAVRAFDKLFQEDPDKAIRLAQPSLSPKGN